MGLLLAYYSVRGKGPRGAAPNHERMVEKWFPVFGKRPMQERGCAVLRDDINKALTEAMKAKNERAVSTLRMVLIRKPEPLFGTMRSSDLGAAPRGPLPRTL